MNIIPLTKDRLEETIIMVNGVFPDDLDAEWSPERSFRTYMKFKEDPKLFATGWLRSLNYWIVLLGNPDEVVAVTGLYRLQDDPNDRIWLGWYCVRADQRGKSLGRELLEWSIDVAKKDGFKKLRLYTTNSDDEARAQELYEKSGFKIVGEEINQKGYKTLYREKLL